MSVFFIETSALVKRYKTEKGTDVLDFLFDRVKISGEHSFAVSSFAVLEFIATLRRLLKAKQLSKEEFDDAMTVFSVDMKDVFIEPLDDDIIAEAIDAVVKHALKASDAVQFAFLLELRNVMKSVDEDVIFVCDDDELIDAGKKEGFRVINPREKDALGGIKKIMEQ